MNSNLVNTDDYGLSFSDEYSGIDEKIQAVFSDSESNEIKAFAANVLIGNIPSQKVNESVGKTFKLCGFFIKDVTFRDERKGKYTIMFGNDSNGLCAFATTSDKVYEALMLITAVYGKPAAWKKQINIRIRMNTVGDRSGDSNNKAYSLEVLE